MKSPFEELQIDPALVCEFFAVFARFEYAMKATRYCAEGKRGVARPDWQTLKADLGEAITQLHDEAIHSGIEYLVAQPPEVQNVVDKQPTFQAVPLDDKTSGAKAIEASRRVRNNLFHGGKHTGHSPPERDEKLILAAIAVLGACLAVDPQINSEFEHQLF